MENKTGRTGKLSLWLNYGIIGRFVFLAAATPQNFRRGFVTNDRKRD